MTHLPERLSGAEGGRRRRAGQSASSAHSSRRPRRRHRSSSLQGTPREPGRRLNRRARPRPGVGGDARAHVGGTNARTDVLPGETGSAICVQRLDDSLNSAIHTRYRSLLRSSSMHEPRGPPLEVVSQQLFFSKRNNNRSTKKRRTRKKKSDRGGGRRGRGEAQRGPRPQARAPGNVARPSDNPLRNTREPAPAAKVCTVHGEQRRKRGPEGTLPFFL